MNEAAAGCVTLLLAGLVLTVGLAEQVGAVTVRSTAGDDALPSKFPSPL